MCKTLYLLYLLTFLLIIHVASTEDVSITIPLNKTITTDNKELYGDFTLIKPNSTIQAIVQNVNKEISFIIFQVHTHLYNVTLYNNTLARGSYVTGTNVGLYSPVKSPMDVFYIVNPYSVDIKLYVSVHGYTSKDPVPGACNMEFPINISPFMRVNYNQAYITVDAAPAKDVADKTCTAIGSQAVVKFYRIYLHERLFDEGTYFDGIQRMMSLEMIQANGEEIPQSKLLYQVSPMRRLLSSYPGTGSIYVAVAYHFDNESAYSVYVPSYTYACSLLDNEGCFLLDDLTSQLFCSVLFFAGLFTCYFGHRFFKTEMFIIGTFAGIIVTYILISLISHLERPDEVYDGASSPRRALGLSRTKWIIFFVVAILGASMISGLCFGAIWLLCWWFYGIPVFSVLLPILYLGFLVSSIFYNGLPGGIEMLETDSTFWTFFITMMLATAIFLLSASFLSNILCCAVLGSYAAIFALDHYVGSHLKFVTINIVRRATVDKFNTAVLAIPFQWTDAMVTLTWLFLTTSGFLFQHYHSRGKPPFPPPPRSVRPLPEDRDTRRYGATDPFEEYPDYPVRALIPSASSPITYDERTPLLRTP